jgi:hypothetical protein
MDTSPSSLADSGFPLPRWPDLLIESENLLRLFNGAMEQRCDFPGLILGDAFAGGDERVEEAYRVEAMQARFAPEGLYIRARLIRRAWVEPASSEDEELSGEAVIDGEVCLSFVPQRHVCPFIDVMGGWIRFADGREPRRIDPFGYRLERDEALEWGVIVEPNP